MSQSKILCPLSCPWSQPPLHGQQVGWSHSCHHQQLEIVLAQPWTAQCSCRQHTGNPQQPLSPRNHHILLSLLWPSPLKISHFSLASTFATSNLFSHRTFWLCHNNLLAFCWTAMYRPGSYLCRLGKTPLHLSISDPYFSACKNSPRECCFYCCCIFLSCPFILNKLLPPPHATCSHLWPALPLVFNYHFTYLLWLYAESLTLENTLHVALLSLRCWLDWLLSWPWGQDSTQRP